MYEGYSHLDNKKKIIYLTLLNKQKCGEVVEKIFYVLGDKKVKIKISEYKETIGLKRLKEMKINIDKDFMISLSDTKKIVDEITNGWNFLDFTFEGTQATVVKHHIDLEEENLGYLYIEPKIKNKENLEKLWILVKSLI